MFKSSLSEKEIEKDFEDFNLFESIKEGLEEAIQYEQGKRPDTVVHIIKTEQKQ